MPLDIGAGLLLALGVAEYFGFSASPGFIGLGVLFALLPDLDIAPGLSRTHYDHRSSLHYPALWVVPAAIVWFLWGPAAGALFALCVAMHFMHDTLGIGWGVAWGWPFSRRRFLFPEALRRREYGRFMTWLPDEEPAMAAKYHDPAWVRTYYLRPNPVAYIEYGFLLVAVAALVLYWR